MVATVLGATAATSGATDQPAEAVTSGATGQVADLLVTKTTTGGTGTFTFDVDCDDDAFDQKVTITDSGSQSITGIPTGTRCGVTEDAAPGFISTVDPPGGRAFIDRDGATVAFTNVRKTADLVIDKTTTGGTGTFTFHVDCDEDAFDQTVTIADSGTHTITGIPTRTGCRVTEAPAPGFISTVDPPGGRVRIDLDGARVAFTNVRKTGDLVIKKTTTGGTGTFTFNVDCTDDAFDQTVTITDSGTHTITDIPTRTECTVTEDPAPGFTSSVVPADGHVTIRLGSQTIAFTNVAETQPTGNLVINKTTTGGTGTFSFNVDCTDDTFDQVVTISDSGSRTITGIPTGTSCTVTEGASATFTSVVVPANGTVTIGNGDNTVSFTNTLRPPVLSVTKTADAPSVTAGDSIGFTVTVASTGPTTALGVTLNDPLPTGTGLNWAISPTYTGPGTCSITGAAPAQQTLACSFGDMAPGTSASVQLSSATSADTAGTFPNTATARARNHPEVSGSAEVTVTPQAPQVAGVAIERPQALGAAVERPERRPAVRGDTLPRTGVNGMAMSLAGVFLIALGTVLRRWGRRREGPVAAPARR